MVPERRQAHLSERGHACSRLSCYLCRHTIPSMPDRRGSIHVKPEFNQHRQAEGARTAQAAADALPGAVPCRARRPEALGRGREGYRMRQALAEDGEQVSNQVWRVAINLWVHGNLERRVVYLKCLTEGAPRYDLHGNVSGEVSAEEAAHAAAQLPECERQLAELRSARHPQAKAGKAQAEQPELPA